MDPLFPLYYLTAFVESDSRQHINASYWSRAFGLTEASMYQFTKFVAKEHHLINFFDDNGFEAKIEVNH